MADFDNLFDAAIARADETIRGYMGTSATMTSGEQSGAVICGVVINSGRSSCSLVEPASLVWRGVW